MSKHTRGPWEPGKSGVYSSNGLCISGRHPQERDNALWAANARLIAAAPELLEALQECITEPGAACFTDDDQRGRLIRRVNAITEIARAAIAKATSELAATN